MALGIQQFREMKTRGEGLFAENGTAPFAAGLANALQRYAIGYQLNGPVDTFMEMDRISMALLVASGEMMGGDDSLDPLDRLAELLRGNAPDGRTHYEHLRDQMLNSGAVQTAEQFDRLMVQFGAETDIALDLPQLQGVQPLYQRATRFSMQSEMSAAFGSLSDQTLTEEDRTRAAAKVIAVYRLWGEAEPAFGAGAEGNTDDLEKGIRDVSRSAAFRTLMEEGALRNKFPEDMVSIMGERIQELQKYRGTALASDKRGQARGIVNHLNWAGRRLFGDSTEYKRARDAMRAVAEMDPHNPDVKLQYDAVKAVKDYLVQKKLKNTRSSSLGKLRWGACMAFLKMNMPAEELSQFCDRINAERGVTNQPDNVAFVSPDDCGTVGEIASAMRKKLKSGSVDPVDAARLLVAERIQENAAGKNREGANYLTVDPAEMRKQVATLVKDQNFIRLLQTVPMQQIGEGFIPGFGAVPSTSGGIKRMFDAMEERKKADQRRSEQEDRRARDVIDAVVGLDPDAVIPDEVQDYLDAYRTEKPALYDWFYSTSQDNRAKRTIDRMLDLELNGEGKKLSRPDEAFLDTYRQKKPELYNELYNSGLDERAKPLVEKQLRSERGRALREGEAAFLDSYRQKRPETYERLYDDAVETLPRARADALRRARAAEKARAAEEQARKVAEEQARKAEEEEAKKAEEEQARKAAEEQERAEAQRQARMAPEDQAAVGVKPQEAKEEPKVDAPKADEEGKKLEADGREEDDLDSELDDDEEELNLYFAKRGSQKQAEEEPKVDAPEAEEEDRKLEAGGREEVDPEDELDDDDEELELLLGVNGNRQKEAAPEQIDAEPIKRSASFQELNGLPVKDDLQLGEADEPARQGPEERRMTL